MYAHRQTGKQVRKNEQRKIYNNNWSQHSISAIVDHRQTIWILDISVLSIQNHPLWLCTSWILLNFNRNRASHRQTLDVFLFFWQNVYKQISKWEWKPKSKWKNMLIEMITSSSRFKLTHFELNIVNVERPTLNLHRLTVMERMRGREREENVLTFT